MTATSETSKQQRAYELLRSRVLDGTYPPGYRLVIDALARELEVSQMPVREAIRRLEAEGLLVYQRNQGAQVSPLDTRAWTDVMEMLAVVEGYATALAAPGLLAADVEELRGANERMEAAIERFDLRAISDCNLAFHRVIWRRVPSQEVRDTLERLQERLDRMRTSIFGYIPTRGRVSCEEHATLVELIADRAEPLRIELQARQHKLNTVAALRDWQGDSEDG